MALVLDKATAKHWVKAAGKLEKAEERATSRSGKAQEAESEEAPDAAPSAEAAAQPKLQIGGLAHKPPTFKAGELVRSTVVVTNNGPGAATVKLRLFVNEALADATTVSVKPGKSKDAAFKWTAQEKNKLNIRGELAK